MEIIERVKAIIFKPKEEWTIIEAENAPHAKVFFGHLLILALIPAAAIFFNYWWAWHSAYTDAIDRMSEMYKYMDMDEIYENLKTSMPFNAKWGIIKAVEQLLLIIGGAYIAAAILNALTNQFGAEKNFDRAFALVAYSFTPLCVAGVLYIFNPLAWLVPYLGLYGAYLLYLGATPQMKPADNKKTSCFVIAIIVVLGTWLILERAVIPEVKKQIYIAEAKAAYKKANAGKDVDFKEFERQMEKELRKFK